MLGNREEGVGGRGEEPEGRKRVGGKRAGAELGEQRQERRRGE